MNDLSRDPDYDAHKLASPPEYEWPDNPPKCNGCDEELGEDDEECEICGETT